MVRRFGMVCVLGLGMVAGVDSALALGPVFSHPFIGGSELSEASFWARPYPYGYSGWGPCIRYVQVETPRGLRLRRVRVCR